MGERILNARGGLVALAVALLVGGTVAPLMAQDGSGKDEKAAQAPDNAAPDPKAPGQLQTTITVEASPPKVEVGNDVRSLPVSAAVLDQAALETKSIRESGEILRSFPGLDFVYYGQGGVPGGPSVRGYTDRNFGQDMAGHLDGIPLNVFGFVASHGALDLTTLVPEAVDRVELVRGPLDARYGDFNRGASVNFVTREGISQGTVRLSGGSYGNLRAAATYGNQVPGRARPSFYVTVDYQQSDGYSDNQHLDLFRGFGRLLVPFGRNDLAFTLHAFTSEWDAPSYLDLAKIEAGTISDQAAVNPTDGGNQDVWLAAVRYRRSPGTPDPLVATFYVSQKDWRRFRSDFLISPSQTQTDQLDDRTTFGYRVEKLVGRPLFGRPSLFVVGTTLERNDAETIINQTVNRTLLRPTDNVPELLTSVGVFVQEQWQPVDWAKLHLGLRYSHVDYDIQDRIRPPGAFVGQYDADQWSPKVGLAVSPVKQVDVFANYATGMRSPTPRTEVRNSLASVDRVKIAETESYEGGVRARFFDRFVLQADVWRADNSNEIRGIPPGGIQFESLGESRRDGQEVEAHFYPVAGTHVYGSLTWVDATLRTPTTPAANHLPDIPDYVHQIGFDTRFGAGPGSLTVAGDLSFYGPRDLNTLGVRRSEKYERLTLRAGFGTSRYRLWLASVVYPGSRYGESAYLFGTAVGVRAVPRVAFEAGFALNFARQ